MTEAIWIAILASSAWGIINTIIGGILVRNRTKSESTRLDKEANKFQSEAEERIFRNLQDQLSDAIDRAAAAEERSSQAIEEAHLQGARVLKLIHMFEEHIPWDRAILELLQKLGVPATDIPRVPELNPYVVLEGSRATKTATRLRPRNRHRRATNGATPDDDDDESTNDYSL
jgi:hypothetical protein